MEPTLPPSLPDPTCRLVFYVGESVPKFLHEEDFGPEETQTIHKGNPNILGHSSPPPPAVQHRPCTQGAEPGHTVSSRCPVCPRPQHTAPHSWSPVHPSLPSGGNRMIFSQVAHLSNGVHSFTDFSQGPGGRRHRPAVLWLRLWKGECCSFYRKAYAGPSRDRTPYWAFQSAPDPERGSWRKW